MNGLLDYLNGTILNQAGNDATAWLPPQASTAATEVDWNFYFILYLCTFFFILVTVVTVYFVFKYRRVEGRGPEPSPSHNTPLEITWTVIPLFIVLLMFYFGFKGFMNLRVPPNDAYEIHATGQKWNWMFTYNYPFYYISDELHVPVNTPVKLIIRSEDVTHSFYVPAMRVKMDAVPGRYTYAWFEATREGEYPLFCAEYCGTEHSAMITKCIVHPRGEFETWLEEAANYIERIADDDFEALAKAGEDLYTRRGCVTCHSVDGVRKNGPSFLNLFGKSETLKGGETVLVDENYVRESILEPQAMIVDTYDPIMPTFKGKLSDKEITAIIEYMKTIKDE